MTCIKAILLVLFSVASLFAADSWHSYSDPFPIRSAISYREGVLVATDGGIRYRSVSDDEIFTSKDGLETTVFYSLASSGNLVLAVSEYGIVASLEKGQSRWKVLNRSFVNNRVRALPDMAVVAGDFLVIGFENRIAFFNIPKKTSVLTIDRIGNISLRDIPPLKMKVSGDSLYVALNGSQYARKMDWSALEKDVRLVDPDSWSRVGKYQAESETSKVNFNGKTLTDAILYEDGNNLVKWKFPASSTGYLVGSDLIAYYDGKSLKDLSFDVVQSIGEIYEMRPQPTGGIFAASYNGVFASHNGNAWLDEFPVIDNGKSNVMDAEENRMRPLSLTNDGFVLYHIWGEGFYLFSDYGRKLKRSFMATDNSLCMDKYVDDYSVSVATTVAPDSLGFLTATASSEGFSLIYITLDGKMSCLNHVGSAAFAGPLFAQANEDGSVWDVYVGTRVAANATAEGGFDKISVVSPSRNSGRLALKNRVSYGGLDGGAPIAMSFDSRNKVLWMVSSNVLGYFELSQDTIKLPTSTKGLMGAEYTSVEVDVQGNVWLGTSNQGVYRLNRTKASNDTLTVARFQEKDGLLKNYVSDIALDPVLGVAWFAHKNGLTAYHRNDLRNAVSMMTDSAAADVIAYPSPFRPKIHSHVSIDNIEEHSSVSIFNRGGALIRYFSGSDVLGGRADWDGKDKNGQLVVPGVYYYVVKGSSKVKKGKILVIH